MQTSTTQTARCTGHFAKTTRAAALVAAALLMTMDTAQNADADSDPSDTEAAVRLQDKRLEFRGLITIEAAVAAIRLYESARTKPELFVIESRGGSADAAILLGHWLHQVKLDVAIDTFCFSSCANYIFTAGRHKVLSPHASLMWHGGVTQHISPADLNQVLDRMLADMDAQEREQLLERQPREVMLEQLQTSLVELIERESDFFQEVGVDLRITTVGQDYQQELLRGEGRYLGWDYSLQDLERLGVRDVTVKGQLEWQPVCPVSGQAVYRIRLDSLPGFSPRLPAPME